MTMPLIPGLLPQPEPTNDEPGSTEPGDDQSPLDAALAAVDEDTMAEMQAMADEAYMDGELDQYMGGAAPEAPPDSSVPEGEVPPAPAGAGPEALLTQVQTDAGEADAVKQSVEQLLEAASSAGVNVGEIEDALSDIEKSLDVITEAESEMESAVDGEDAEAAQAAAEKSATALEAVRTAAAKAKEAAAKQADDNKPEKSDLELWLESN